MDPISDQFPHVSTYNYAENRPIDGIDLWGLQYFPSIYAPGISKSPYPNGKNINPENGIGYVSTTLDFTPIAGDIKGFVEVFTNKDLLTGATLGPSRFLGLFLLSELRGVSKGINEIGSVGQKVSGELSEINKVGGAKNCEGCAIATDATLKGFPASALGDGLANVNGVNSRLKKMFGSSTSHKKFSGVIDEFSNLGEGSTGIITVLGGANNRGHAFNVANINGQVKVFDGQMGAEISQDQLSGFLNLINPDGVSFSSFNTTNKN